MKLKCILPRTDFVPMLKLETGLWMPKETLQEGSEIEVAPEVGYALMATFKGAFKVLSHEDKPERKPRTKQADTKDSKQVKASDLEEGFPEQMESQIEG